jgi:LAS superfamily LD-carboxypeptidase LdcB
MNQISTTVAQAGKALLSLSAVAGIVVVAIAVSGIFVSSSIPQSVPVKTGFLPSLVVVAPEGTSSAEPAISRPTRNPVTEANGSPGEITEADGKLPDGATVFDDQYAGIANLDPVLLQALREAAQQARDYGIVFYVNSGWRSPAYQNQLLSQAIVTYGSKTEASRWVAPANKSAHVSGHAIDLETTSAKWLTRHGAQYGLCQIYDNEPWHYELRPEAQSAGCPTRYADPTKDPRLR